MAVRSDRRLRLEVGVIVDLDVQHIAGVELILRIRFFGQLFEPLEADPPLLLAQGRDLHDRSVRLGQLRIVQIVAGSAVVYRAGAEPEQESGRQDTNIFQHITSPRTSCRSPFPDSS